MTEKDHVQSLLVDENEKGSSVTTMLAPEQVAAIVKQLKAEHARLLWEQQEAIVHQVVKRLRESGLDDTEFVKHAGRKHRPLPKLEQNLHNLFLRSLDESGLNYPHVQQSAFSPTRSKTLLSTRPSSTAQPRRREKVLIVSRPECTTCGEGRDEASTTQEQNSGQVSGERVGPSKQQEGNRCQLRASSLEKTLLPRRTRVGKSRKARTLNRRGSKHDADFGCVEEQECYSQRSKIGRKTLAILDRSQALLEGVKQLKCDQPKIAGKNSFVCRMRQKLAEADCPADHQSSGIAKLREAPTITEKDVQSHPSSPVEFVSDNCASPAIATRDEDGFVERCHSPSRGGDPSRAICDDIDVLRPPEHSPENDHEWENELARQILSIYATSVKAKAGNRPSSRSIPASADASAQTRLASSCSLPAINQTKHPKTAFPTRRVGAHNSSPPRATVHYSWEPSQRLHDGKVIVNMPKVPKPIWFAGTGAVKAVWCAIAEGFHDLKSSPSKPVASRGATAVCDHQLCEEVRCLEAKQQFSQSITMLETLLISLVRARGVDSLEMKLWKQLVVTCNAFASRCVDYKKFSISLQLIKQAEDLIHNSILVEDTTRLELLAYLYDTYAHYYYKRGKTHAGLQYMFKAQEIHTRQSSWSHLAKCRLHIANLLSSQSKHRDAMGYMASILQMIEESKLEDQCGNGESTASAQKICLAAVCYNNLAVEQLHLREFEAASVSTGNAKRLARLCLSYSNRWLAQFDATSNCVDLAIATLMEDVNAAANAAYKTS